MATTRDQIIEATCTLLELQGYHATGMNQIIKESGSPKGSLYYYFPGGKDELTAEALERVGKVVLERIRTNLAQADEPAAAVRGFIHGIAQAVDASGYTSGGPITTVAMETAATNDHLRTVCNSIYEGWQAAVAERLVMGGIAPDRAQRLATLVIASIEGGIILCRTGRTPQPLQTIAEELYRLVDAAVL